MIPVGPNASDALYLRECVESLTKQTVAPAEIVIVDDMHGQSMDELLSPDLNYTFVRNAWNLGVSASFNVGVTSAPTDHVLLLGSDDLLEPDAIACAQRAIAANPIEQAYFYFRVRYSDGRPDQSVPCGAAVVTKALWRASGGFPVESAVGRSDVMLVGMLMGHPEVGTLVPILDDGVPQYFHRIHPEQHTASRFPWIRALEATAEAYWTTWEPPRWGRFS